MSRARRGVVVPTTPHVAVDDLALRLREARVRAFLGLEGERSPEAVTGSPDEVDILVERAAAVFREAISPLTRRSYASRWNHFTTWAESVSRPSLPASSGTVVLYLTHLAMGSEQVAVSTLRGRVAAIDRIHREAGEPPPGADPALRTFLTGLVHSIGPAARRDPIKALRVQDLRIVSDSIKPTDARLVRDTALVALYAADVPPAAIAGLRIDDVRRGQRGLSIPVPDPVYPTVIRRQRITDSETLPARSALLAWMATSTGASPYLFTTTDSAGQRSPHRISAADVVRTVERRAARLSPTTPDDYAALIWRMQMGDPWAHRDRAMILVGFAAALRCASLSILKWGDIADDPAGIIVHLRHSKTDRDGRGRDIGVPAGRSHRTCPVRALAAWRSIVVAQFGPDIDDLPLFVAIRRSGSLTSQALRSHTIATRVVVRAQAAGIPGHWGGRSLRAGFISSAADLEIPLEEIARQSGHATLDNLVRYIRVSDPFHRNAASSVGL